MSWIKRCLSLLLLNLMILNLNAQVSVKAQFTKVAPEINGRVSESVWEEAVPITEFFQREPDNGVPVSQKTEVYILYDQNYLYFGFKCFEKSNGIVAKELARDVSLKNDDRIQIILDTFLDQRNGYWFQIGPRGSIGDALVSQNGAALNKEWDGLWEGRSAIHEQGWDCECAIPFKTLNFHPGQTTWGLKLIRNIQRRLEASYWPVANLNTYRFQVSDAGLLTGLEDISQGIGLDLNPYTLTGWDQKTGQKHKFPFEAGLDMFYQVTPSLKSAITVNTDFAQTEVDARQINLTRFKLHFPEKRDFFLDGANYFYFGIDGDRETNYSTRLIPFFSRRIGLDGSGNPIPILGGAKITGQVGDWNLGFLDIMDEREGKNKNFFAARVSRNIGKQSMLGMIATHGNATSDADNFLYGLDLKLATSTFQKNKNLALLIFGLKSKTAGLVNNDYAYGAQIAYPNDLFLLRLGFHEIAKNFQAGMGFIPRHDIRETYLESALGPRPNRWGLLQVLAKIDLDYITNLENRLLTRTLAITPLSLRFKSGDNLAFTISPLYEHLTENFKIHPEHQITTGGYDFLRYSCYFESALQRNFWATAKYSQGKFYDGNRTEMALAAGYKIAVPLFLGLEAEHNDISLPDGDFTTQIYRLNVNFLFSPFMTLYNYIQYDNLSQKMGWQSRFRWILKPGTEILLVWNSVWQDPLERHEITESTTRLKFRYVYRF